MREAYLECRTPTRPAERCREPAPAMPGHVHSARQRFRGRLLPAKPGTCVVACYGSARAARKRTARGRTCLEHCRKEVFGNWIPHRVRDDEGRTAWPFSSVISFS